MELVRAFRERARALPGVAGKMRPIDFCTPKHSDSSTRASPFPSVATVVERNLAARPRDNRTHSESCDSCSSTRKRLLSRSPFLHRTRACLQEGVTGWLGAIRCGRGRGASWFTTRRSLRRPREGGRAGRCFPRGSFRETASDTPVASLRPRPLPLTRTRCVFEGPPRSVPRAPCE